MMRIRRSIIAAGFVLAALPAWADTPDDIVDLLGARAPGAETQMQARGYADVNNNTWWNAKTAVCVKVHVSNGRYATIDEVSDADCGKFAETSAGSEPSKAAMDACMNSADELQEEAAGSSIVKRVKRSGANWVLTLSTGGDTSHCTVTQSGEVISMDP
jgi:hypothetical protein